MTTRFLKFSSIVIAVIGLILAACASGDDITLKTSIPIGSYVCETGLWIDIRADGTFTGEMGMSMAPNSGKWEIRGDTLWLIGRGIEHPTFTIRSSRSQTDLIRYDGVIFRKK